MLAHDLSAIGLAFLLWPLVIVAPGYAATLAFDPLGVARRSWAFRLLLAVPLSVCVAPILLHWLWRFGGVGVAWAAVAACAVVTLVHVAKSSRGVAAALREHRLVAWAFAAWVVVYVIVMVPLPIGDRLFMAYPWTDFSKHVAMTSTLTRTGVPPQQPYFFPGHAMPTYYYYGWFLLSSLIEQLGRGRLAPYHVMVAGGAWTSLALWAALLAFDRFLFPVAGAEAKRRVRWLLLLLLVTGLDAIPVVARAVAPLLRGRPMQPMQSVESWNEQVTAWTDLVFWTPHHVSGIIAALLGMMVVRGACAAIPERTLAPRAVPWRAVVLAGITFGSCLFTSVYLGMAAVLVAAVWGLWSFVRRRPIELASLAASGAIAGVLCVPYLLELKRAQLLNLRPLAFSVRMFLPLFDRLHPNPPNVRYPGEAPPTTWGEELGYLAFLPLSYAVEFGFFAFVAWVYLRRVRRRDPSTGRAEPFSTNEQFALAIGLPTLLLCTFVKSAIVYNDLGWRAMHLAQAVLLVWGVSVMIGLRGQVRWVRSVAWTLLAIGIFSSALDLVLLRGRALWVAYYSPVSRDRSRDAHALRLAYDWMAANLPRDAVVQYDPIEPFGFFHGDFGQRQVAIGDPVYGTVLGLPKETYLPWKARLDALFGDPQFTPANVAVLRDLRATHLIVMDSDRLWAARGQAAGAVVYENAKVAVLDVTKLPG